MEKSCCLPIGVLASFLIPFRSVAQEVSPPVIISFERNVQKPYSLVTINPFQTASKVDSQDFLHNPKDRIEKRCNCAKDFQISEGEYSLSGLGFGNKSLAQAESVSPVEKESSQDVDELIQQIRNSLAITSSSGRTVTPALTVVTPIGFGGYLGSLAIGGAYQAGTASGGGDDGSLAATISLGNPQDFVSFDLTYNMQGLSNTRGAPNNFGDGTLSFQVSRLLANDWSIGLGVENFVRFSGRNPSNVQNYYLVTTKIFSLDQDRTKPFSVLYTSIGLGTGRFLPPDNFDLYGGNGVNVFGSVAVQLIEGVNGIVEWSGQDLDLGLSFAPFSNFPLIITPAVVDVIGNSSNSGARFVLTGSIGIFF